jgi:hypothetical protein
MHAPQSVPSTVQGSQSSHAGGPEGTQLAPPLPPFALPALELEVDEALELDPVDWAAPPLPPPPALEALPPSLDELEAELEEEDEGDETEEDDDDHASPPLPPSPKSAGAKSGPEHPKESNASQASAMHLMTHLRSKARASTRPTERALEA